MPSPTAQNEYAPTTWGAESLEDLVTPSGQKCQVRRPGVEGLIQAGVISSVDSLTGIVQNVLIPSAEGRPKIDADKLMENPKAIDEILHVVDRVVCHVVVQPHVEMSPNDVTRREAGVIYTDMIELEDRMYIMNFAVGGTRDLEEFRKESSKSVGGVGNVKKSTGPAKRVVRNK